MNDDISLDKQVGTSVWSSPVTNIVFQALTLALTVIIPLVVNQALPTWAIWIGWLALVALGVMASVSITSWVSGRVRPWIARRRVHNQIKDPISVLMGQMEQLLSWSHTRSAGSQLNQLQSIGALPQEAASAHRAHLTSLALQLRYAADLFRASQTDAVGALRALADVSLMYLRLCGDLNSLVHDGSQRRQQDDPNVVQHWRSLSRDWSDIRIAANVLAHEMTRLVSLANIAGPTGVGSYFPTVREA
jgi:hypothetical protein